MKYYKAIFSFARLPKKSFDLFIDELKKINIEVCAVLSHQGENKVKEKLPTATHIIWASYTLSNKWNSKFDKDLYDKIFGHIKDSALPLVERYGPFVGGSMQSEIRLSYDFSLAHELLLDKKPNMILFAKAPESGIEYCLYKLANYFSIPTYFTRNGIFPHSRLFAFDLDAPVIEQDWSVSTNILSFSKTSDLLLSDLSMEKILEIRDRNKQNYPDYMKEKGISDIATSKYYIQYKPQYNPLKLVKHFFSNHFSGINFMRKLYKYSESVAKSPKSIDLTKKIYYFPLAYQPEQSSMPTGYEFVNQIKLIKFVADNLDDDELLIVKEHPIIFDPTKKTNVNFRTKSFYDWINKIPKVVFVSVHSNPKFLLDSSFAVVSIASTPGLEAMINEKPVLLFGNAFYRNGPGVSYIKTKNDLLESKKVLEEKFDFKQVKEFLARIESVSHNLALNPYHSLNPIETKQDHYIKTLISGLRALYCKGSKYV